MIANGDNSIMDNRQHNQPPHADSEQGSALERFSRDLTEAARNGKLDPVIGRDDEIRHHTDIVAPDEK